MTQGERIKNIRLTLNLTLEKFGEKIGVTKAAISRIEKGERNCTDQMTKSICREFNVNEDWLRNGNGEMFNKTNRNSDIAKLTKQLLDEEDDSFKNRFVSMLANLNTDDWKVIENIAEKLAHDANK